MLRKGFYLILLVALVGALAAGCGGTATQEQAPAATTAPAEAATTAPAEPTTAPVAAEPKVLVVRTYGDPQSFNPDNAGDDAAYGPNQNIYSRLVKLDASKAIIPDLASSWDFSEDGRTITFHLVQNATWHDGVPVTAADVKYTFEYIKATDTYFFNGYMQNVTSIETPDDYTVVFTLAEPNVALIGYLGWYGTFIVPQHIYDNGQTWDENTAFMSPIGSGPFSFSEFVQGEKIVLNANPNYFGGAPKVDQVIYRVIPDDSTAVQALVNGEIDVLESVPAAEAANLLQNPDVRMVLNTYPSPMYVAFNFKYEPLQDVNLRTAIAMAINKQEISDKVFLGQQTPENDMYPSSIGWATNNVDTAPLFNPEGARALLESSGYTLDADGYYVRGLTLDIFEGYGFPESGQIIQSNLKDIGVEVILNVMEYNAWNAKVVTNHDYILELQGGYQGPDPAALGSRVMTGAIMNQSQYSNPEVDALFEEGNRTGDQTTRAEIYKHIQAILAKDLPLVPIVSWAAYDANRVNVINLPIDMSGKTGWAEYTFTEFVP